MSELLADASWAGALTAGIIFAALCCGAGAHYLVSSYGTSMPRWQVLWLRFAFGFFVFATIYHGSIYFLWKCGIPLKIAAVIDGKVAEGWWLTPLSIFLAYGTYVLLRHETRKP